MTTIIWLIILGCVVWFVKYAINHQIFKLKNVDPKLQAFELLKKRFANREIKVQEYEAEKRKLKL